MRPRACLALAALLCAPHAYAQAPQPASGDTILSLAATARIPVTPDCLVATLHASVVAPTASAASAALNHAMAEARATARPFAQLRMTTGDYQVSRREPDTQHPGEAPWQADQSLQITALQGTGLDTARALFDLVGQLQAHNLATDGIGWSLSPDSAQAERATAVTAALKSLRDQANQAAAALGMHFTRFRTVTIDDAQDVARPMMAMAVRMRAEPEVDQPQDTVIGATARGDAELTP